MSKLKEFHIDSLTLYSFDGLSVPYSFEPGINYIQGPNSSGKTEFFLFLDYMFGREIDDIASRPWYSGTLKAAVLSFTLGESMYEVARSLDGDRFAFKKDGQAEPACNISDYREKLNSAFCSSLSAISGLHYFTEQELTYRTFSMFSFCEDTGMGKLNRFFTKLSEEKYAVKERPLFDYLFNRSPEDVVALQKDIRQLEEKITELEDRLRSNEQHSDLVNARLADLGISVEFDGTNTDAILDLLATSESIASSPSKMELSSEVGESVDYLEKQIREMEFLAAEQQQIRKQNNNRFKMLNALDELIREHPEYASLTESTMRLLRDLKASISIRDDAIYRDLIRKKKNQLKELKRKSVVAESAYSQPSYFDSKVYVAMIRDYLKELDPSCSAVALADLRAQLKNARSNLRALRLSVDQEKIDLISSCVTGLYRSTACVGGFSDNDVCTEDLQVEYVKEGNTLQPIVVREDQAEAVYTGSRARHTLIQIAGYYAFMLYLCRGNGTPTMPFVAFDHASSPFDDGNAGCIGALLSSFYEETPKESVQTFLFENRSPEQLLIEPDRYIMLRDGAKSGFNPFFSMDDQRRLPGGCPS